MKIKQSWEEVTIAEFHKINEIINRYNEKTNLAGDDIDFMTDIISVLSGLPVEEIEKLPHTKFEEIEDKVLFFKDPPVKKQPQPKYTLGDHVFSFPGIKKIQMDATVREMKAIQYIDSLHIAGDIDGLLLNIHTLLAVILKRECSPSYNEESFSVYENAEIIKNHMSIVDALSVQAFFLSLSDVLTEITKHSSKSKKTKKIQKKISHLLAFRSLKNGDGSKTPEE